MLEDQFNEQSGRVYLRTGISTVHWYDSRLYQSQHMFERVKISSLGGVIENEDSVSWFDRLFEGGICMPD